MSYLVIPNGVSSKSATVWLGGISESLDNVHVKIIPGESYAPFRSQANQWKSQNGQFVLDYRRDVLIDLESRRNYRIELHGADGSLKADADFTTLPSSLPALDDKPFIVMLSSCFCVAQDKEGKLGNAFSRLPSGEQPDVKIWCGDQVYLDAPWHHYSLHTHNAAELEVRHFQNYQAAWSQSGTAQGFNYALKHGANYFSSDDHEFWNNAPNWTTLIRDSWSGNGRNQWWNIAKTLYQAFQCPDSISRFTVGSLSFFIADTRLNRDGDQKNFMSSVDIREFGDWVAGLKGPGVFSLGQPLFATRASGFGRLTRRFSDWNLPDYDQFPQLARIISSSMHSLVMLTGDVHYGRVARTTLPSGLELTEVISSPTSLVDPTVGGKWSGPPDKYPSFGVPGLASSGIRVVEDYTLAENHFLTIQFAATGMQVRMRVLAWPISDPGGQTKLVYETYLQ